MLALFPKTRPPPLIAKAVKTCEVLPYCLPTLIEVIFRHRSHQSYARYNFINRAVRVEFDIKPAGKKHSPGGRIARNPLSALLSS